MSKISLKCKRTDEKNVEYGEFLDDFSFDLTNPATPRPWANLLSNEEYLLTITQLGSGFSCYKNAAGNMVTPNPGLDGTDCGRFFYLRNSETDEIFSPTVFPVHADKSAYSDYRCIYAPGSMEWKVRFGNTSSRLRTLVCMDENTELHLLELTNHTRENQSFDCFLYLEWLFGGAPEEWGKAIYANFDEKLNAVIADVNLPPSLRFSQTGFLTATESILDYDCRRLAFIGTMGSVSQPAAVRQGKCCRTAGPEIGTTCGAVRVRMELPPQTTKKIMFAVGVAENVPALDTIVPRYTDPAIFEEKLRQVKTYWNDIFAKQQIKTPDDKLSRFFDKWLKCQVIQNARWTRWAMGKGYRDVLQDSAGTRLLDTKRARQMITEAIRHQKSDGHAPRQWSNVPFGKTDWRDYRDSCFWLIYALDAYLRETGEYKLLDEEFAFIDSDKKTDVWTHANLAIDYLWSQRGAHGLCLIGHGDWLDSMNQAGLKGKGESVWLTQALRWALLRMTELAQAVGKEESIPEYKNRSDQLSQAVNKNAWDGNWYLIGFNDEGQPIGSRKNTNGGNIFLNSQSWAVISQSAPADRIKSAFDAVDEYLGTEVGPLLYAPRYKKYDPSIGRITIGASEADAIYVHAAAFKIQAEFMLGHGDTGYELLQQITPAARRLPASQTGAEPFCCVNAFAGSGWAWPGWSYVGWWSATCDWMLQVVIEWLFGARAEHSGLKIDPCLPSNLEKACIIRNFRNAEYEITIEKQKGICKGKISLELDGKKIQGDTLPALDDGKRHKVTCVMTAHACPERTMSDRV